MSIREEYWQLSESEHHFNTIQAGIRNRASTWILAAFAAIAVLIQVSEQVTWLVPSAVLIGLVSLMATVGLVLLWINDQVVFQKLLSSVFMVGLKWEYEDPQLPPIRMMMMYASEGKGMSRWMTLYYTIPMICFFVISLFVTLLREHVGMSSSALNPEQSLHILVGICVVQASISVWVYIKKSKITSRELAANFGHRELEEIFSNSSDPLPKLKRLIERHNLPKIEHASTVDHENAELSE